jgi:hypothetical protein
MKRVTVISYLVALIGAAMLTGACFYYAQVRAFVGAASRTQGTVIALRPQQSSDSTTYVPVVRFQLGPRSIEFDSRASSNPPSYQVGETVPVLYLPSNPYRAKIDSFFFLWGGPVILASLGSFFFLIGGGFIATARLQKRTDNRLMQEGVPVQAEVQQIDLDKDISVNGRHPFRVVAQWQDPTTAQIHVFESHNVWFNPSKFIKHNQVRVFMDRSNPKRYYVDLSFLPKLAN